MASTLERWSLLASLGVALGCRPAGLPPEPPEHDAASAEAEIPAYGAAPNPLSTSAFDGVALGGGGHAHHGHGGHAKAAAKEPAAEAPASVESETAESETAETSGAAQEVAR